MGGLPNTVSRNPLARGAVASISDVFRENQTLDFRTARLRVHTRWEPGRTVRESNHAPDYAMPIIEHV